MSENKKRKEKATTSEHGDSYRIHPSYFTPNSLKKYESDLRRNILKGFTVELEDLECPRGRNLRSLLNKMGWMELIDSKEPVYPSLVRQFYANMRVSEDLKVITSMVDKKKFTLTAKVVNDVLGIPNQGDDELNRFDEVQAIRRAFSRDDYDAQTSLSVANLSFDGQILHWIVSHILKPVSDSFENVDAQDCKWLAYIMEGHKINLGQHIIYHMQQHTSRFNSPLVYGTFLTQIFAYLGIDFDTEEDKEEGGHNVSDMLEEDEVPPARSYFDTEEEEEQHNESDMLEEDEAPQEASRDANDEILMHLLEMKESFRAFRDDVIARMNRMEQKIDRLTRITFPDYASGSS